MWKIDRFLRWGVLLGILGCGILVKRSVAQTQDPDLSSELEARFVIRQAIQYLFQQQRPDGSFSSHPGITAMVLIALTEAIEEKDERVTTALKKARDYVRNYIGIALNKQVEMGVISDLYSISVALMAFSLYPNDERDVKIATQLQSFLLKLGQQSLGFGYGPMPIQMGNEQSYSDLSNTQWVLEALRLSGITPQQPEYQLFWWRMAAFMETCQVVDPTSPDYGGYRYYPFHAVPKQVDHPNSPRPWGSLTLGAIKTLLYAGRDPSSLSVQQGIKWILQYVNLQENPGLGDGGYYYYVYLFSSTMIILERFSPDIVKKAPFHPWRRAVVDVLLKRLRDGSHWKNQNPMWLEGNAELCTAYAIKSLLLALKP